jgi:E3 ubiquitin-protein ligase BOI-like protein
MEQLRQAIEERTQRHSKALLATLEEEVARRLRERDVELERVSKRALDLEERVKHLSAETQSWQSKAKGYESMVTMLRANLQHALIHNQNRAEQSKLIEGCGDSEADDAVSVHIDNNVEAQQSRAMMTTMMMMRKKRRGASAAASSSSCTATATNPSAAPCAVRCCRKCGLKEASLLLLPCLHLCLCHDCNAGMDRCPVCNLAKSAYVEVYLC